MTTVATEEREVRIPACAQHDGYASIRVRLPWRCLHCDGPRGEPQDVISWDGSRRLACHGWVNPCGHVELYREVRNALALGIGTLLNVPVQKPFVVVANPGMADEFVVSEHGTCAEARRAAAKAREDGGFDTDVMKRLPDGSLTTEF